MARRRLDRDGVKIAYLEARQQGLTVRDAAAAAGVHVATVCRWRHADPAFDALVREPSAADLPTPEPRPPAATLLRLLDFAGRLPRPGEFVRDKPSVRWHSGCPACGAGVRVRKVGRNFGPPFWRCSRWPKCKWASWRPRHPENCESCGGPRYWAHSRKSVHCPRCGTRTCTG